MGGTREPHGSARPNRWRSPGVRTYLVAFLTAIGVSALATPVVLHLSRRLGLFDPPDGERKLHVTAIARTGGVAIALGFLAPILALLFYTNSFALELRQDGDRLVAFLIGLGAILALGVYDDVRGCGAWAKLGVQSLVGVVLWQGGLRFEGFTVLGVPFDLGWGSLPVTILWVAAIVNAMNLIDGLDGLAAGVAFFAGTALFLTSQLDGNVMLCLFAAAITGSVVGFLFYNFSPALIFMGDSGSMTIGYVFAAAALWSTGKRTTLLAVCLPIVALGVPILDTTLAFARRTLAGNSPFNSDRRHIHHRLLDLGLSQRQAVLVLYVVCGLLTGVVVALRVWAF
ncbi:MAG: undecaprenyl/decaprenyl-phosphate alpha-N-acetylglucosaminyl 1-phosphate transferase [Myxococcales bacterium]|nr:undecaprenyl/decaprenyl-phosphate alpha-N-acetylglucosaminyl 1-phosphate transferase [Myxococcales bacterium]